MTALVAKLFPTASAEARADLENLTSVALFAGIGLLVSISVLVHDQYMRTGWF